MRKGAGVGYFCPIFYFIMIRKICSYPGCNVISEKSRCQKHRWNREKDNRLSPSERGYDWRWRKAAKEYLLLHPICNICKKEKSTVVDHITPHRGNLQLFWDVNNWQALCRTCHNKKSAMERYV